MSLPWSHSVGLKTFLTIFTVVCLSSPLLAHGYTQGQFDGVTSNEEAKINQVREQEITQLKMVMGRRFAENRRPDILLRLAELYVEKYRYYFFKENQIHQNQYKSGEHPKNVNHDLSRAQLRGATSACLAILKSKVAFEKLDEVYYFLGYNAEEMGNRREAIKYFEIVASRYPQSTYAPEAFRNLGEAAFEDKKYSAALNAYEHAAQFTKVPSYPRTLYKLGWAYFKTRRRNEALDTMKRVIEVSGTDDKFVGLRDEAMNDLVMFFSEAGRFREAHDYFSSLSGGAEVYSRALGKLSKVYEGRGDIQLAIKVNDGLIAEYGEKRPELVFEALARNVELNRRVGSGVGEETALTKLVDFFSSHSSDFAKNEDTAATYARTKNYLRTRATEVHKDARTKKDPKAFSRAADLYSLYIKAFLSKPSNDKEERELSEIRTYRSDALLAAGREAEATPELEKTLSDNGDAKNRRESGATLLNILIKKIDSARASGKDPSEVEKKFLQASEEFERAFPEDKLIVELRYKKARLAAAKSGPDGLNREARRDLNELVEKFPNRAEAAEAAQELVADLLKRRETEDAVKLAQAYLGNRTLLASDKKGEFEKYLRNVIARSAFESVSKGEKDGNFEKAASEYEALAKNPNSNPEVAYKSLNNAAVNYERSGQYNEAVRVYGQMLAKYPSHSEPRSNLKRLASELLWRSRFAESAKLFSELQSMNVFTPDERFGFMKTAMTLHWGLGNLSNAYLVGRRGLSELCDSGVTRKSKKPRHSKPALHREPTASAGRGQCSDLVFDLAELQIEASHSEEVLDLLRSFLKSQDSKSRSAEANFKIGSLYDGLHERRKALAYYEEATRTVGRQGHGSGGAGARERNFAAHAAFLLVEPYFAQFNSLKLELPEERLKVLTRKKLGELESLVTRYTNVVSYGDGEWGIAALERLSDIFNGFASELEGAPVPPKYEGPRAQAYQQGIRQVTAPMHQKALEYLRKGFEKGLELRVTTPTFVALTQRLSKQSAREYPAAHYALVYYDDNRQSTLRVTGFMPSNDRDGRNRVGSKLAQNPKNAEAWIEFGNLEALSGHLKIAKLMYEQAISLNARDATALCNLSVVRFLENHPVEAIQGFARAAEISEFSRDIKLNYTKALLAYHHFSSALEQIRGLSARLPQDNEVGEAYAAALLGTGQLSAAGMKLKELRAEGSKSFNLWYNWSVWAILTGDRSLREKALDLLKDKRDSVGESEKNQIDVALLVGSISSDRGGSK